MKAATKVYSTWKSRGNFIFRGSFLRARLWFSCIELRCMPTSTGVYIYSLQMCKKSVKHAHLSCFQMSLKTPMKLLCQREGLRKHKEQFHAHCQSLKFVQVEGYVRNGGPDTNFVSEHNLRCINVHCWLCTPRWQMVASDRPLLSVFSPNCFCSVLQWVCRPIVLSVAFSLLSVFFHVCSQIRVPGTLLCH